jgi:hypothetical protein
VAPELGNLKEMLVMVLGGTEQMVMKVLVQDLVTSAYYHSPACWTLEPEEACVFEDSHAAVQFCLSNEIPHAQVVLKFEDGRYDVALPVGECEHETAHSAGAIAF